MSDLLREIMIYKHSRNYENLNRWKFIGVGEYGIPVLRPAQFIPCELIGFNYAKNCRKPHEKGVHFFLDDYQFLRLWKKPDNYIAMLQRFSCVLSPDFSLYADFPKAIQIYNHYRKHWLGAYLQMHGIKVIPTICWSDTESFAWCFDGEPVQSAVAVSSVGCMANKDAREKFLRGYEKMMEKLKPTQIVFYGDVPRECMGNIIHISKFSDKFQKAELANW